MINPSKSNKPTQWNVDAQPFVPEVKENTVNDQVNPANPPLDQSLNQPMTSQAYASFNNQINNYFPAMPIPVMPISSPISFQHYHPLMASMPISYPMQIPAMPYYEPRPFPLDVMIPMQYYQATNYLPQSDSSAATNNLNSLKSKDDVDKYFSEFKHVINYGDVRRKLYKIIYEKFNDDKTLALYILNKFYSLKSPDKRAFDQPRNTKKLTQGPVIANVTNFNIRKMFDEKQECFVIKSLKAKKINNFEIDDNHLLDEIHIYSQFDPNERHIAHFHGYTFGNDRILPSIILECCDLDLRTLTKTNKLSIYTELCMLKQLITGLLVLHEKYRMIHSDIKPGNIFVKRQTDGSLVLKYGDFNGARFLKRNSDSIEGDCKHILTTDEYSSPEGIGDRFPVTTAHDVYSLGRTLQRAEMQDNRYSPTLNHSSRREILNYLKAHQSNLVPAFQPADEGFKNIVNKMVVYNYKHRIKLRDAAKEIDVCLKNCQAMPDAVEAKNFRFHCDQK